MPTYEFRCRACGDTFTVRRSMDASGDPATCPDGHTDTVRLLTTLGLTAARVSSAPAMPPCGPMGGGGGGGCCGGGACGMD